MARNSSRASLKFKIIISFLAVIPIIVFIGFVAWLGLADVNKTNSENEKAASIMRGILDANACAKDFRIKADPKYIEAFSAIAGSVSKDITQYRMMVESDSLRKSADMIKAGFEDLQALFGDLAKNQAGIKKLTNELNAAVKQFTEYADTVFRKPLSERQNMAFINGEQLGASVAEFLALINRASENFYEIQATYLSSFLSSGKEKTEADAAKKRMAKVFAEVKNIGKI